MPQVSHLSPRVSLSSRCREWRQVKLRRDYEHSLLDPTDDEAIDLVVTVADDELRHIERAIVQGARELVDIGDAADVITVALAVLREYDGDHDGRASALLKAVRIGLDRIRCPNIAA